MMGLTLTGCATTPKVVVKNNIPSVLTEQIIIPSLHGHYSKKIEDSQLRDECAARGKDVINLVSEINIKNNEISAIKLLNNPEV